MDDFEDWEDVQARRDEADYQRGISEVENVQALTAPGSAERDEMYRQMEQAAYDRGDD